MRSKFALGCARSNFFGRQGLTLSADRGKSKSRVSWVLLSFYAEWRVRSGVVPVLHEDHESPPERLLQAVWQNQRLLRDRLSTLDGRPVRVLHPGFRRDRK